MSLDSLFQQILLTEQQLAEQTQKFKEVKVDIIKCKEKIKATKEKFEESNLELDEKAQQLCANRLHYSLLQRTEEQMTTHMEELRRTREHLWECLASIKQQAAEEQEKFLEEISRFNSDMSLQTNPETLFYNRNQELIQELLREEGELNTEMEQIIQGSRYLRGVEEEKKALLLELHGLNTVCTDVEKQLREAEEQTHTLRAQSAAVNQRPLTDPTCVRMRTELDTLKEGEMELLREALSSEILFLQNVSDTARTCSMLHPVELNGYLQNSV
ncbi:coiled-coil domain-containing protein 172 [Periophthalmus magnuspinnatus]|uniref:coiled-coil domain-containing protein 172 n=1 Tax=Periophthalmus magnuspinnatus TaxID=409849 RepID=UPI00145B9691|nr:coiled-coil domain-containing protein 172 [Periophthalmus magnuspinnatus]